MRRRLEMAERVRDFVRAQQLEGVGADLGLAKLEELLQRAQALSGQQQGGVATSRAATRQRQAVRRKLQDKVLRYLRVVGQVAAKHQGELANQFPLPPSNATQEALRTAARKTLERATAQQDVLVGLGMSQQVLDDLTRALGEFEETLAATRAGRREHVGARADLEAIGAQIAEQVRLLDGVVRYRFGENAELMAAWASARNVLGPFKSKEQETPSTDSGQASKVA